MEKNEEVEVLASLSCPIAFLRSRTTSPFIFVSFATVILQTFKYSKSHTFSIETIAIVGQVNQITSSQSVVRSSISQLQVAKQLGQLDSESVDQSSKVKNLELRH